jgi:hypothetical protein
MVSSFSFLYPPTPVNHVSKMWPGNSFQLRYILIFGVNIGSILTISQFGMYVCMYVRVCMYVCTSMSGKLVQLLFLRLSFLVDYDTRLSVLTANSYPVCSQDAVFCCSIVFLNVYK